MVMCCCEQKGRCVNFKRKENVEIFTDLLVATKLKLYNLSGIKVKKLSEIK